MHYYVFIVFLFFSTEVFSANSYTATDSRSIPSNVSDSAIGRLGGYLLYESTDISAFCYDQTSQPGNIASTLNDFKAFYTQPIGSSAERDSFGTNGSINGSANCNYIAQVSEDKACAGAYEAIVHIDYATIENYANANISESCTLNHYNIFSPALNQRNQRAQYDCSVKGYPVPISFAYAYMKTSTNSCPASRSFRGIKIHISIYCMPTSTHTNFVKCS